MYYTNTISHYLLILELSSFNEILMYLLLIASDKKVKKQSELARRFMLRNYDNCVKRAYISIFGTY